MPTSTVRAFKHGVYKLADSGGAGGQDVITVKMNDGGMSTTINTPAIVMKDRGDLDHAIAGEEEPLDWSLEAEHRGWLGAAGTPEASTMIYEAMYGLSSGSDWDSDEPDSDLHSFIQELTETDPGDASTETITIPRSFTEQFAHNEGREGNTITASGRAMVVHPTIA